jgi:molybdate transport repressor ModE-like protein
MTKNSSSPRHVLTPETLAMLQTIAEMGSFAAAARATGIVPSALTYRVHQVEQALDVVLFDRNGRHARLTEAGKELVREGTILLNGIDAVANRIRRVATGWEGDFTIAVDAIINRDSILELCQEFLLDLNPPTRLRLRDEALSGTLEALVSGNADLALGIVGDVSGGPGITVHPIGHPKLVFAVAPRHPLAKHREPLSDEVIRQHRAVVVADSVRYGKGMNVGVLAGQDTFTVPDMEMKLDAQLRGLGVGFLPQHLARSHIQTGRLIEKRVERTDRQIQISYGFRSIPAESRSKALRWWLDRLEHPVTKQALLDTPPHLRA